MHEWYSERITDPIFRSLSVSIHQNLQSIFEPGGATSSQYGDHRTMVGNLVFFFQTVPAYYLQ
jgi:hypothetical protein